MIALRQQSLFERAFHHGYQIAGGREREVLCRRVGEFPKDICGKLKDGLIQWMSCQLPTDFGVIVPTPKVAQAVTRLIADLLLEVIAGIELDDQPCGLF